MVEKNGTINLFPGLEKYVTVNNVYFDPVLKSIRRKLRGGITDAETSRDADERAIVIMGEIYEPNVPF
jgi:hypothetical protein